MFLDDGLNFFELYFDKQPRDTLLSMRTKGEKETFTINVTSEMTYINMRLGSDINGVLHQGFHILSYFLSANKIKRLST